MAPSSAVVSTLRRVTDTKLAKLAELQKTSAEKHKALLAQLDQESSEAEKVRILVKEVRRSVPTAPSWVLNVEHFLDQVKHDPSVTSSMLKAWRLELLQVLDWQSRRHGYTTLFSKLVTEWIENPNDTAPTAANTVDNGDDSDSSSTSSALDFEPVGREEMHKQREQWEQYAFGSSSSNKEAIFKYLDGLFPTAHKSKGRKKTPLESLRDSLAKWHHGQHLTIGGAADVKRCIKHLLNVDLFAGDRRQALEDLVNQPAVLGEIADVLNSDLASLDKWEWTPSPIALSMRKQLNGKYRVYMEEDIYQAIMLQYIGSHFAVALKKAFVDFFRSGAWLQAPRKAMSRRDALRREFFLGTDEAAKNDSIRDKRRNELKDSYFMTQLPDSFSRGQRDYSQEDVESDSEDESEGDNKSPLEIKQKMLYLITTENLLAQEVYDQFTVLQSDFKWFGPSMPHSTVLSVLEYFHVPSEWLRFFRKFMTPKLYFVQDGERGEVRQRTCGLPMSHTLSDAIGDAVLFCLDFAVNQKTKGGTLYRFHDDLWYWGVAESCETTWKVLNEFSEVMGLEINMEKTGTVTLTKKSRTKAISTSPNLPKGEVRWGFLVLDSAQGKWIIDQKQVDEHVVELRRQLGACRSVFAYVQAYNAYVARFMVNNFGWPANCLGQEHVDICIATVERIQKELYEASGGTIVSHLRQVIKERFSVTDLPDAFFYFPNKLGALGVANPMITLLLKRRVAFEDPSKEFQLALADEEQYDLAKSKFENGKVVNTNSMAHRFVDPEEDFMSFAEFNAFVEQRHVLASNTYDVLQQMVSANISTIRISHSIRSSSSFNQLDLSNATSATNGGSSSGGQELAWILELYGHEVLKTCGDLAVGEREMLPLGLLGMLKSERVRWQG